ncbi:uncharacterized protein LOC102720589 [Oryza brachyantha]|uniref:uncharacterized protein LOC102720589 n=1 Tax=Oryza brachyantha TaxID=4533 RepID=UPI001AD957C8|nr:uncharacterized protein LOC102720589 [Oryza brachyantha]
MLQASSEAAAAGMWVPGMSPQGVDAGSARAQEIARRREEMLGMLRDLPESEYELSLTDLVEKTGGAVAPASPSPSEGKEQPGPGETGRTSSGRQQQPPPPAAGRPERRGSARRRDSGGSSFRSSSDGVLLNFYMPRSLTRSFTAPRPAGPGRPPSVSGGRSASICSDRNKRERDGETVRCWSLLWDRRWRKSSRGDHAGESAIRAAILKAAKHDASSPKKV